MDRLDPVKAPPPIPRAPATRRERRRQPDQQVPNESDEKHDHTEDDSGNEHTIDEYA